MADKKICAFCGKEFVPSKNDERIKYCSNACYIGNRKTNGYMGKYYQENKQKWIDQMNTEEYKEKRKRYNENRRERYKNDEKYREEAKKKVRDYYKNNPEKRFAQHLKDFGITPDEYREIHEKQGGKCAICGSEIGDVMGNRLYIDHNHKTGKVRGLLCSDCNFGIGKFKDNIELMQKAIQYLEETDGTGSDMVRA